MTDLAYKTASKFHSLASGIMQQAMDKTPQALVLGSTIVGALALSELAPIAVPYGVGAGILAAVNKIKVSHQIGTGVASYHILPLALAGKTKENFADLFT